MTIEERLTTALREADGFEPSPDLFARVERSIAEDRAFRRRRLWSLLGLAVGFAIVALWIALSLERDDASRLVLDSWKMVVAYLAVAGAVIVGLAPHIKRFARSFVDDVFHLTPETGGHFLSVLDIAYYVLFVGFSLVDADLWALGDAVRLDTALGDYVDRLGWLLLVMGVLHAANIAALPVLGIVYNSIARHALRAEAGDLAPPESARARTVDRHARSLAIGIAVFAVAVLASLVLGAPGIGALLS